MSPSASVAVTAAPTLPPAAVFSATERVTVELANAGARLTLMSKVSLTEPPLPSLAVTFTDSVPASEAVGVPAKVRVESVKPSQVGSAVPSDFVAV